MRMKEGKLGGELLNVGQHEDRLVPPTTSGRARPVPGPEERLRYR